MEARSSGSARPALIPVLIKPAAGTEAAQQGEQPKSKKKENP